jgi:hypothetical protein
VLVVAISVVVVVDVAAVAAVGSLSIANVQMKKTKLISKTKKSQ